MEFTGRVKKLLPVRSGVSQRTGNEWKSLPFVFEYYEHETDRYADSVVLETFDTKVIDNLKEGMEIRCGFSHHTREYDGKTYNELRLYRIESVKKVQNAAPQATNAPQPNNNPPGFERPATGDGNGDDDDLPF
jgi:hypothetical protein